MSRRSTATEELHCGCFATWYETGGKLGRQPTLDKSRCRYGSAMREIRRLRNLATKKAKSPKPDIAKLLREYTDMPGHPSFADWKDLKDRAVIALAVTEGV
jgi:hypothetical protein